MLFLHQGQENLWYDVHLLLLLLSVGRIFIVTEVKNIQKQRFVYNRVNNDTTNRM